MVERRHSLSALGRVASDLTDAMPHRLRLSQMNHRVAAKSYLYVHMGQLKGGMPCGKATRSEFC